MAPILLHFFLSLSLYLWPQRSTLRSTDRWRENCGLVYRSLCTICRHPLRVDNYNTTAPFWYISEKNSKRKSFQWAELQAVNLVVHFSWKKKWFDYIPFLVTFCHYNKIPEKNNWKEGKTNFSSQFQRLLGCIVSGPVVRYTITEERAWQSRVAHFVVTKRSWRRKRRGYQR
jgi:hypothetical protein